MFSKNICDVFLTQVIDLKEIDVNLALFWRCLHISKCDEAHHYCIYVCKHCIYVCLDSI